MTSIKSQRDGTRKGFQAILPEFVGFHEVGVNQDLSGLELNLMLEDVGNAPRDEHVIVRHCAVEAGKKIGLRIPLPIHNAEAGNPVWPSGVVGSLTHSRTIRAAAIARSNRLNSVGIDVEELDTLKGSEIRQIMSQDELRMTRSALGVDGPITLFSLKESLYKAWYPVNHTWLGFRDVTVHLELSGEAGIGAATFRAVCGGAFLDGFTGQFVVDHSVVRSAVIYSNSAYNFVPTGGCVVGGYA
ncbi:4'-phosphopantetheinyl transferase superfamily protein [Arthrobacter sp. R1-13]